MNANAEAKAEAPQLLNVVLREMTRRHSQALMYEHLAEVCADLFRGSDSSRGPRKLLQLANGARCRAEVADVVEVEAALKGLAAEARAELQRLKGASVVVPPAMGTPPVARSHPPDGETVADNPEVKQAQRTTAKPSAASCPGST